MNDIKYIDTERLNYSKLSSSENNQIQHLHDNWITIRVHKSGCYVVVDERYEIDSPFFDTLDKAIEYGKGQIGE